MWLVIPSGKSGFPRALQITEVYKTYSRLPERRQEEGQAFVSLFRLRDSQWGHYCWVWAARVIFIRLLNWVT